MYTYVYALQLIYVFSVFIFQPGVSIPRRIAIQKQNSRVDLFLSPQLHPSNGHSFPPVGPQLVRSWTGVAGAPAY